MHKLSCRLNSNLEKVLVRFDTMRLRSDVDMNQKSETMRLCSYLDMNQISYVFD